MKIVTQSPQRQGVHNIYENVISYIFEPLMTGVKVNAYWVGSNNNWSGHPCWLYIERFIYIHYKRNCRFGVRAKLYMRALSSSHVEVMPSRWGQKMYKRNKERCGWDCLNTFCYWYTILYIYSNLCVEVNAKSRHAFAREGQIIY